MNLFQGFKNICKKLSSDEAIIIFQMVAIWICLTVVLSLRCKCDISTCYRSGDICDWDWPRDGIPSKMMLAASLTLSFGFLGVFLGILSIVVVLLYQKIFHRTIIEIKPNGDQPEPIGRIVIKPFNRISMV